MKSDGAILINKHRGITSFDIVSRLRQILRVRRTGHCGTLDPLASGLVIVCFGRATKLVRFITGKDKQYTADILLGRSTDTYDRYGVVTNERSPDGLSAGEIEAELQNFVGIVSQSVPSHSAVKHQGLPMYRYARKGVEVPEKIREVVIHRINLIELAMPHVVVEVTCSKGTYIRSIANELGRRLGCGAHLFSLCRTRIGRYSLENALTLNQVAARLAIGRLEERIIGVSELLDFPRLTVEEVIRQKVQSGGDITASDVAGVEGGFSAGDAVSLVDSAGRLLAVGSALVSSSEIEEDRSGNMRVFKYTRVI